VVERVSHPVVLTGHLPSMMLARSDTVTSVAYLRFGNVPDTAGITGALLGLRFRGHEGSGLRVEAFAIDSLAFWSEDTLRSTSVIPFAQTPLSVSGNLTALPGDSVNFEPAVAQIPPELIRIWKRHPGTGGIALRLQETPPGSLVLLSREAVLDTTGVANPRLRLLKGSVTYADLSPTADAYTYTEGPAAVAVPPGPVLPIAEWLPRRVLIKIDIPGADVLPKGSTINRATLRIHFNQASYDSSRIPIGVYASAAPWTVEGTEPDSAGVRIDVETSPVVRDSAGAYSDFQIAPLVQLWADGVANNGLILRSTGEGSNTRRLLSYSAQADSAIAPQLEMLFTPPQDPRWSTQRRGAR